MHARIQNLQRITQTRYPRFVFGLRVRADDIPVFTYHDVEPDSFERDIHFLMRNDYRPLSLRDFGQVDRSAYSRSVLLTFDDARRSFYDVVFPILLKYQIRATLFVPTYWVGKQIKGSRQSFGFMNWGELREVAESGLIDVQSHGHRHTLVFTSDKLVAFSEPRLVDTFDIFDWPMHRVDGEDHQGIPPLGIPIYRAAPLLSCRQRMVENSRVNELCQDFVNTHGGSAFFATRDWRGKLRSIVNTTSDPESTKLIDIKPLQVEEFAAPYRLFQDNLGYTPTHLAYPWMLGNRDTLDLARDHGIRTVFGVGIDFGKYRSSTEPRVFGRYKSDWIRLLPGEGRDKLLKIVRRKLTGGGTSHLAH